MEGRLKICKLIGAVGTFEGTTKLHKTVYVAQLLGYQFGEHFQWYRHGPYSPSLAQKLQSMVAAGLVDNTSSLEGPSRERSYALTETGRQFLELFGDRVVFGDALTRLIVKLHEDFTARNLELIDSILFWEQLGLSREDAIQRVVKLKPKFAHKRDEIARAEADIEELARFRRKAEVTG